MLEQRYLEDQKTKEDRRKRFAENEAKMRRFIKKTHHYKNHKLSNNHAEEEDDGHEEKGEEEEQPGETAGGSRQSNKLCGKDLLLDVGPQCHHGAETEEVSAMKRAATAPSGGSRPKWALTEDEACLAEEKEDDNEALSLMAFAKSLDFNRYMDDLEVKTMINQVAKRIHELETSKAREEADDAARAEYKKNLKITSAPFMSPRSSNQEEDETRSELWEEEMVAMALAKGVLAKEQDEIGQVHSGKEDTIIHGSAAISLMLCQ